jgi:hypothetical protein
MRLVSFSVGFLHSQRTARFKPYGARFAPHMPRSAHQRLATPNPLSWDKISAQAVGNNDDHVIKMTYTCRCEAKQCGNPLYQASAARLVAVGKA